ncbi:YebC/PmpR family DNA-binding transcriptional regulator [Gammaproteobacteria bacterium]|nr:YebC/PmpR family DNA-binding transcriptional regulator [Gammaproteobacteria bacterium]
MAGHSKWANIQHRKGRQDKARGKLFTKLIREVTVAARIGGSDLDSNPRLRTAVDKAKSQSMPKDNIERAISKGSGEGDDFNLEEVTYEGYGPGGVAILIESMTDNRNRTVAEVRHALTKFGGNLGAEGSVSYLFKQTGLITLSGIEDEDKIVETAIELGAEDIEVNDDGSIEIMTSPNNLVDIKDALSNEEINIDIAEVTMKAATDVSINLKHAQSMMKLLDMLDDLDDIQTVHSNAEISNDILEQLN